MGRQPFLRNSTLTPPAPARRRRRTDPRVVMALLFVVWLGGLQIGKLLLGMKQRKLSADIHQIRANAARRDADTFSAGLPPPYGAQILQWRSAWTASGSVSASLPGPEIENTLIIVSCLDETGLGTVVTSNSVPGAIPTFTCLSPGNPNAYKNIGIGEYGRSRVDQ